MDQDLDNKGIVHGSVDRPPRDAAGNPVIDPDGGGVVIPSSDNETDWAATAFFNEADVLFADTGENDTAVNANETNATITEELAGGVLIEFDTCFEGKSERR